MTVCPKCESPTDVTDSRPASSSVRRRRRCPGCDHRFTTFEVILDGPVVVVPGKRVLGPTAVRPLADYLADVEASIGHATAETIARLSRGLDIGDETE